MIGAGLRIAGGARGQERRVVHRRLPNRSCIRSRKRHAVAVIDAARARPAMPPEALHAACKKRPPVRTQYEKKGAARTPAMMQPKS
ncbi:hypothetical protein [Burkholderia stagnalis]